MSENAENLHRTSPLDESFQTRLESIRRECGFPGATAAYLFSGGPGRDFATGFSDLEHRLPLEKDARFLSASIGKMHVGALAFVLHRQKILDLEAPVSRYLGDRPWFSRLPNAADITLRHLLSHSAGLMDHVHVPDFLRDALPKMQDPDFYYSPEQLIEFILDLDPLFPAGQGFTYTDTGFIIAGLVIEKAAGKPYYDLLRDLLLDPAGLVETIAADRRALPGLVPGYLAEDNPFGLARSTMKDGLLVRHPLTEWTGGGLADTALGLVKWSEALFNSGLVAEDYTGEVLRYAADANGMIDGVYGLGTAMRNSPLGQRFCHGGWIPGYRSDVSYYPDLGLSVSLLINTDEDALISNDGIQKAALELADLLAGAGK